MAIKSSSSRNGPINTTKDRHNSRANTLTHILLAALILIALAGITYSILSWFQNRNLESDIADQKKQIQVLSKQVNSLKSAQAKTDEMSKPATPEQPITGKVKEAIDTKSGRLLINYYKKTSRHEMASEMNSTDPILLVYITVTNTTNTTQTYSSGQFKFVDSTNIQNDDIDRSFTASSYSNYLGSITAEPGGSIKKDVLFDKYDSKQGTFKWMNNSGQEIRVTFPGV